MRGATLHMVYLHVLNIISIHAPRAGCDKITMAIRRNGRISIHAPHAGCDDDGRGVVYAAKHFNPRTPCGVRLAVNRNYADDNGISIHAPLAGCDEEAQADGG